MIKLKLASVIMGAALAFVSTAGAEAATQQIFLKFPGIPDDVDGLSSTAS
jgi:hypothetical protein